MLRYMGDIGKSYRKILKMLVKDMLPGKSIVELDY